MRPRRENGSERPRTPETPPQNRNSKRCPARGGPNRQRMSRVVCRVQRINQGILFHIMEKRNAKKIKDVRFSGRICADLGRMRRPRLESVGERGQQT